jgi:alpha-beta hydrolase superfamily lysophospholipase
MRVESSVYRVTGRKPAIRPLRLVALFAAALALLLLALAVLTLTAANRMMRQSPLPLDTFSSNVLPDFNVVSFPSLDAQTTLQGWFFPAKDAVSTVVLIHSQGKNRLQFGLDSAYFYEDLIGQGYCVLAFDLRNSGESGGSLSGYGYAEWADVLAAIAFVRKHAATRDVLLYGFGSGTAAALLALDRLPPPGLAADASAAAQEKLAGYPDAIRKLGFDQSYVRGLLLDTPCESPDAYIAADCREDLGWLGRAVLQHTVPYAIRLSASGGRQNLVTILTRSQLPVFIAYSQADDRVGAQSILPLVAERQRLHPETTAVFAGSQPGFAAGFIREQDAYLFALHSFLQRSIRR